MHTSFARLSTAQEDQPQDEFLKMNQKAMKQWMKVLDTALDEFDETLDAVDGSKSLKELSDVMENNRGKESKRLLTDYLAPQKSERLSLQKSKFRSNCHLFVTQLLLLKSLRIGCVYT